MLNTYIGLLHAKTAHLVFKNSVLIDRCHRDCTVAAATALIQNLPPCGKLSTQMQWRSIHFNINQHIGSNNPLHLLLKHQPLET